MLGVGGREMVHEAVHGSEGVFHDHGSDFSFPPRAEFHGHRTPAAPRMRTWASKVMTSPPRDDVGASAPSRSLYYEIDVVDIGQ